MLSGMSGPVEGPPAQAFMPPGGGLKPKASAHMEEVAVERVPVLAMVTSLFPLFLPFSCYVVQPSTHAAVLHCGTLTKMQTRAGLHCTFPSGKYVMSVSVKEQTLSLPDSKITDSRGSPILVSAIVNYRVLDAKKALFAVEDYRQYIETNATSVLKQVVGTHTYDGLKIQRSRGECGHDGRSPEAGVGGGHFGLIHVLERAQLRTRDCFRHAAKAAGRCFGGSPGVDC